MSEARLENLANELAAGLTPVKPMGCPLRRILLWLAGAALYTVALVFIFGLRPDIGAALHDTRLIFETALTAALAVSAALAAAWLAVPDMRGREWAAVPAIVLTGVFLFWIAARGWMDGFHMPHDGWHICAMRALAYGLLPGVALVLLSRRGATVRPRLMGLMNALAVGATGWLALRYTCPSEDAGHIFLYHFIPYAVVCGIVAALARRLYRW